MTTARTLLIRDDRFLGHDPGPQHPESPSRLASIHDLLDRAPLTGVVTEKPRPATVAELSTVHTLAHAEHIRGLAGQRAELDPDTSTSAGSVEAALLAAGGAVQAVESVWRGEARNAFLLARPPGHHAERDHAMGFCLFNNVAIAAEAAVGLGAERVLVLDWDVHHGNGTQHSFWNRRDVLYMSSHQFPFYPGTGAPDDVGAGPGAGYTVNAALSGGQTDADLGAVFHDLFLPIAQAYRPQLILVSAGFDAHAHDPLGGLACTERGFAAMTSALSDLADAVCGSKLVLMLEGGYHLGALAASVHACLGVMTGARREAFPSGAHNVRSTLAASRAALAPTWNL